MSNLRVKKIRSVSHKNHACGNVEILETKIATTIPEVASRSSMSPTRGGVRRRRRRMVLPLCRPLVLSTLFGRPIPSFHLFSLIHSRLTSQRRLHRIPVTFPVVSATWPLVARMVRSLTGLVVPLVGVVLPLVGLVLYAPDATYDARVLRGPR